MKTRLPWEGMLVGGAAVGTLLLGYAGFGQSYPGHGYTRLDLLYLSLQLFVLEFNTEPGRVGSLLQIARFAAPILSSYAAVRALMTLFAEPLREARLRRLRGHVVVCGLNRKGLELVKDARSRGVPVVVIEWDKENDLLGTCRDLGAYVVPGDATEQVTLRKAGVLRARSLFAVCGDDGTNAEIALCARTLAAASPDSPSRLRVYIHIESLDLCDALNRQGTSEVGDRRGLSRVFNIYENAARQVFQAHPLDRQRMGLDDPRTVHLIVVGFGRTGQALALQAAKIAHYANGRRLALTVIDPAVRQRMAAFRVRHPLFEDVCDLQLWDRELRDPQNLELLARQAEEPQRLTTVAVCLAPDAQSLSCGISLANVFRDPSIPILVRMDRRAGLAVLAGGMSGPGGRGRLRPFLVTEGHCTESKIEDRDRDRLAEAIHEEYRSTAEDPSCKPWDALSEELKEFNRQAADHVEVKLRAVGWRIIPERSSGAPFEFTGEELVLLARMEHRRWCASQSLAGYRGGETPDGRKDSTRKVHPLLIPWERLPESERDKCRRSVTKIPQWLAMIGNSAGS